MDEPRPRREPTPRCPRCGYDLSGITDTWTSSCPVEGVCSECGLRFPWLDVFHPLRDAPRWLFEHARGRLFLAWAFVSTLGRTMLLFWFWRSIKLVVPVSRWRLAIFVVLSVGLMASAPIATRFALFIYDGLLAGDVRDRLIEAAMRIPFFVRTTVWAPAVVMAPFVLITPLTLGLLGETFRRAKVRGAHVARLATYAISAGLQFVTLQLVLIPVLAYSLVSYPGDVLIFVLWAQFLAVIPWTFVAYWMACRQYLRIPHPAAVSFFAVLIALLATGLIQIGIVLLV